MMRMPRAGIVAAASLVAGGVVFAQVGRGGSEWLTAQGDAQRTSWIRSDAKISVESMATPGFALQWTSKTGNGGRQLNGLMQGVTANGVTLFVPVSIVAGSSNTVAMIDNDTGYIVWQRQFEAPLPAPTPGCVGGITAAATRIVSLAPVAPTPGRAGGRGAVGYRSLLGEPGEGVPVEARGGGPGRAAGPPPAAPTPGAPAAGANQAGRAGPPAGPPPGPSGFGAPGRGAQPSAGIPGAPDGGGPGGGLARPSGVVYVIASDGRLHVLGLQSGKDLQRPAPFLPANAQWSDPVAVGTMLYTATTTACGGSAGVWAIDLDSPSKPVVSWMTRGGSIVGNVALTTGGTLLAAVGPGQTAAGGYANAIVALDPKTLAVKDWFTQPGAEFVTGPTVFQHNGRDIVAAATRSGRVLLLDAASLGGANHATPLHRSAALASGGATVAADAALATWQQAATSPPSGTPPPPAGVAPAAPPAPLGTRWLLAPVAGRPSGTTMTNGAVSRGAVVALRLVDTRGRLSLTPAWTSHDLLTPATPVIVNGVVFALSSGRPVAGTQGAPAVVYAYDGATGKSLWTSAQAIDAFASPRSFWSAMGQVYVGTHDGTVYAFGFLDERR